jgi:uncharacterized protein YgbK (DUF1537 family)
MIPVHELGIMADDLTGACDVAGCFARRLGPVRVTVDPRRAPRSLLDERRIPVVLNTQSRTLSPRRGRARLARVAPRWRDSRFIFKKIDAALRGPLGAELEGLTHVLDGWDVVIAPALPSIGRTTENGRQLDRGTPIHLTDYAADPLTPILTSDVREAVRSPGSARFQVKDASTPEDLRRIVAEQDSKRRVIFVGSLGLADAVAEEVVVAGSPGGPSRIPPARRVLVVCGSSYPRAAAQLEAAIDRRGAALCTVGHRVPGARSAARPRWGTDSEGASSMILKLEPGPAPGREPRRTSSTFADLAKAVTSLCPQALAIIGGETAYQLLTRLGTRTLEVRGRVEEVVSFGIILDGALAGVPFAMKGGSVGAENAVVAMIDLLAAGEDR